VDEAERIDPESHTYKFLLELATKGEFVKDLKLLRSENITSFNESFHSLSNLYRPKRRY